MERALIERDDMEHTEIQYYEIWKDETIHLMNVWAESQEAADSIAKLLGGTAHYEMAGIVVPDESYLK